MNNLQFYLLGLLFAFTSCVNNGTKDLSAEICAIENGLVQAIQLRYDSIASFNIHQRMQYHKVPGVSVAVVQDRKLKWARGYGIANSENQQMVETNTLFQAASISKPLVALAALKLVEQGRIELDEDVNFYLKNWKIPENRFSNNEKVTLRRLLTHTAGMTVDRFPGYQKADTIPSIEAILRGKGNTSPVFVDTIPGSIWRYSGGGYTIVEKIIEDVSGLPLEEFMRLYILQPLGMKNSTYEQPLSARYQSNASTAFDINGMVINGLWHIYPEQAAAGLWTTPSDIAKYCMEIQNIVAGKGNGILKKELIKEMITKHINDWGLGPSLAWDSDSLRFQHGGKNAGFTCNMLAFAYKGDAMIIMTNSDNGWKLIMELQRSISKYYHWGINTSKTIEAIKVSDQVNNDLTGVYEPNFNMSRLGDNSIEIKLFKNKLYKCDRYYKETNELAAIGGLNFVDLDFGDEILFQWNKDTTKLLINNQFEYYRSDK